MISEDRLRAESTIVPTPQDKGLQMTIKITAYDRGIVEVDGTPMSDTGWPEAVEVAGQKVDFLRRMLAERLAGRPTD